MGPVDTLIADQTASTRRQRGFQHLFVQARAFQAALDRREYRSITALAKAHVS